MKRKLQTVAMDRLGRELETSKLWSKYDQLISDVLTAHIAGIWTICTISGVIGNIPETMNVISFLPYVSIQLQLDNGQYNSTHNPLITGIEFGCSAFVVDQSVALDFLEVFVESHDEAGYRYPIKYVLIQMDDAQSVDFLKSVQVHPSLSEIMNLIILRPSNDMTTVDLLTNRYVGSLEHANELYIVDVFYIRDNSFQYGNPLFPDKTIDLSGKPIQLATFNINPHMFFKESDVTIPIVRSENRPYSMDGLNGIMLVNFCEKRNCSIEIAHDDINMWGVILPNRTGNGMLGNLVKRQADIGVGAISSWYHCYKYLAFSTPIERGIVTCLAPKPLHLPRWIILAMAFPSSVYLTIFATFCSVVSIYMLITHFMMWKSQQRSLIWNVLNVLAILLLQATNVRHRSASETILSLALLLFGLNLSSIYSGKFASLRTVPLHESVIDTMTDLADSGIPWLQAHEAWSFSLLLSDNPTIMKLVSNFRVYSPSDLRRIADAGGSAFAMGRLHNGHLMLGDWITADNIHKYRLMREPLYYEHEIAMGTKTWPLMEAFNEIIGQMGSGLLLRVQELRIMYQYNDYYIQTVALNSHEHTVEGPNALGLEDILGGVFVLGFGVLCAGVTLILELLHARKSSPNV